MAIISGYFDRRTNIGSPQTINAGAPVPLQLSTEQVKVRIDRVRVRRNTGAAAANYTPRIDCKTGQSAGSVYQVFIGANTAAGTMYDATNINAYAYTDTLGRLYLYVEPSVDGDTWEYEVFFTPLK